ncbi:ComEC/Rec2 family competence protein [Planctomonas psychrotolerans]|uniref:ComEC/Rec2 family competence protein n=1 Tax=Planctomonas psychrotolerans TaxID=2528712 RepID=UPI00123869F3|nr:ComEC/Rec2 family competence protein [Planctomonas psychrotolerans]
MAGVAGGAGAAGPSAAGTVGVGEAGTGAAGAVGTATKARRTVDWRLVPPAFAAWFAAFVLVAAPVARWPAAIGLWLFAGVSVGLLVLRYRTPSGGRHFGREKDAARTPHTPQTARDPRTAPALSALSVGLLAVMAAAGVATVTATSGASRQPAPLLDSAATKQQVAATLVVTEMPAPGRRGLTFGEPGVRLRIRATVTELHPGSDVGTSTISGLAVPVLVFAPVGGMGGEGTDGRAAEGAPARASPADEIAIGATIRVSGSVTATAPEDDVAFLLFARGVPELVASPGWLAERADALRTNFRAAAIRLPGDGGALLPGLAIGDTTAVPESLDEAMKASSLSHLTAVSGANCAVVVAGVLGIGAALGAPRRLRVALALVALVGFVLLVTPQPSVLRAALMATIVLAALASGRPARGIPSLALAVIVLVLSDPWLSRDYGFVLSVLATTGLLLLARPLAAAFSRVLPRWLAAALALPTAAQLACQPVLILLAPTLPLYGVPANLLAAPAAPVATMLGLVACLVLPVLPIVGAGVVALAWLPSSWIAAVASFTAMLPLSRLPWLDGVLGMASVAGGTAVLLLAVLRGDRDRDRYRAWRRGATVALLVLMGGYAGGLTGAHIRERLSVPTDWQYAVCDVGQGDAVLVRGGTATALVDVGPAPEPLERCLQRFGIHRIDLLILSHYDLDHIGGIDAVIGRADRALVSPPGTAADRATLDRLVDTGTEVVHAHRGMTGSLGTLAWRVHWPRAAPTIGAIGADAGTNDASVVLSFEGEGRCVSRCVSSMFLGDLGEEAQVRMAAQSEPPEVDVVKVAHHGSADQSARLYRLLGASVGLIPVGADNTYGHPTDALLHMLASAGTAVARTDSSGAIAVSAGERPGELAVWRERSGE